MNPEDLVNTIKDMQDKNSLNLLARNKLQERNNLLIEEKINNCIIRITGVNPKTLIKDYKELKEALKKC